MTGGPVDTVQVAIIGAGPGGLCMAKRLLDEGITDFRLLERSDDVGGTWNHNSYPGCECDVPSALFSFSFEFKTDWSKPYGTQPEILAYMRGIAEKYGILPHVRFGDGVAAADWDEVSATWLLTTDSGATLRARAVVSAVGMFNEIVWPDIEGFDSFGGTVFHSARWNHDHDLTGERVAVVGSAASAVQFVPEIVKTAGQVHLFQRTANWVMPKDDTPYTPEQLAAFREDPTPLIEFRRMVEDNMNRGMTFAIGELLQEREVLCFQAISVVKDPITRTQLRPTHPFGAKRPLLSNVYFESFNRENLELVTDPIVRITPSGVETADGVVRAVDTIVAATGFATTKYLSAVAVRGRDGVHIDDAWSDGARAYLGVTTAGFPNLYMIYGPNTNNGSILTMLEFQVEHALAHIRRIVAGEVRWIDVKPDVEADWNEVVQDAIAGVRVWQTDTNGYYRVANGRVVTQWPFSMEHFRSLTAVPDPDAFEVV